RLVVDPALFAPRPRARVSGRVVAVAGADKPLKGVSHLLRACARLRATHGIELQLVARLEPEGPTEKLIAELGLSDIVTVRSGLSDDELAELLASAEIACIPSLYEGFSLPAVEAMASGTPLVVSRAGALPEVVGEPGVGADLITPGDAEELTAALGALFDAPLRRAEMSRAGRERALSVFSWESVAAQTTRIYQRAIDRAKGAPE